MESFGDVERCPRLNLLGVRNSWSTLAVTSIASLIILTNPRSPMPWQHAVPVLLGLFLPTLGEASSSNADTSGMAFTAGRWREGQPAYAFGGYHPIQ